MLRAAAICFFYADIFYRSVAVSEDSLALKHAFGAEARLRFVESGLLSTNPPMLAYSFSNIAPFPSTQRSPSILRPQENRFDARYTRGSRIIHPLPRTGKQTVGTVVGDAGHDPSDPATSCSCRQPIDEARSIFISVASDSDFLLAACLSRNS
jgi:hypothetical protein